MSIAAAQVDTERQQREPYAAFPAASTPSNIGHITCEEVGARKASLEAS